MSVIRSSKVLAMALVAVLAGGTAALAQDVPDLVGTWKAVDGSYTGVRVGVANDYNPEFAEPDVAGQDNAWSIVFEGQKGRAVHGYAVAPNGDRDQIVGVLNHDSTRLLISGDSAGLFGEFVGDRLEICYQDHDPDRAGVACYLAAKQ